MSDDTELYHFEGSVFEWNRAKAASNLRKHGVTFGEGATVFSDEFGLMISDPDHSNDESRFLLVGRSRLRRVLVVVSVERGEKIRIISARRAVPRERRIYEKGRKD